METRIKEENLQACFFLLLLLFYNGLLKKSNKHFWSVTIQKIIQNPRNINHNLFQIGTVVTVTSINCGNLVPLKKEEKR